MKIQNPHDKFFKETFSNVEVAKDFVRNYLPKSIVEIIDMKTMERRASNDYSAFDISWQRALEHQDHTGRNDKRL